MNLGNIFSYRRKPRTEQPQKIISRQVGKVIGTLIVAGIAGLFGWNSRSPVRSNQHSNSAQQLDLSHVAKDDVNINVIKAIENHKELQFAEVKNAKVVKLIRADNRGARHQRWLIQLSGGVTITVVHNIDLAEKVPISIGDEMDLAGELVFGDKKNDPILHWTHADPRKKHMDGYIIHNGKKYGDLITQ